MKTEIINRDTIRVYFTENCAETFTFKGWEGYGKRRVYVSSDSSRGQIGYIDMESKQFSKRSISTITQTAINAYLAQAI